MGKKDIIMNEDLAKRILREVKEVLEMYHIEFWLNFGALLGAVREGKFIEHDDDIELNAWKHKITEHQMQKVCKELCQREFSTYYSTLTDYITIWKDNFNIAFSMYTLNGDKAERPHEHIYKSGVANTISRYIYWLSELFIIKHAGKVNKEALRDIRRSVKFFAVSLANILPESIRRRIAILLRYISMKAGGEYGKTRIPAKFYLNLRDLIFYDMIFKVPSETEEYLVCIYGSGWRVPLKNWKFYDDENRAVVGIEIVKELWDYK